MLGNIGPLEIGIVLVIALLVFGPKRLPELGNGVGKGMREFKSSVTGESDEPARIASEEVASSSVGPKADAEATPDGTA
jgi:sec-independent protein translocase protein TatA